MWFRGMEVFLWLLLAILPHVLSTAIPTSVTEIRTDITTYSNTNQPLSRRWIPWLSNILKSRQAPTCGTGLLTCEVQDPTRLEAPWHGVNSPFPQCYDPSKYVCSSNFLCPIGAPKIDGQYACGPYANQQTQPTTNMPAAASSQVPAPTPGCGAGLLVCEVQDPTRLEAPWHGIAVPFPQCYDPAKYVCSDNFLCPIGAPKIDGQYACGPYESRDPSSNQPTQVASSTSLALTSGPTQTPSCGTGTLLCEVQDPTRLEAPWHGVAAPFPQCYDPALYVCSDNFLCPIKAPKIPGQYACGPYESSSTSTQLQVSSASVSSSTQLSLSSSGSSSQLPTFSTSISSAPSSQSSSFGTSSISQPFSSIETSSVSRSFSSSSGVTSSLIGTSSASLPVSSVSSVETSLSQLSSPISSIQTSSSVIQPFSSTSSLEHSSGSGSSFTSLPSSLGTPSSSLTNNTSRDIVIGSSTYFLGTGLSTVTDNGNTIVLGGTNGISIVSQTISVPTTGDAVITTDGLTISVHNPTVPISSVEHSGTTSLSQSTILSQTPGLSSTPESSQMTATTQPLSSQTSSPSTFPVSSTPPEVIIGGSTYTFPSISTTLTEPHGQTVILGPSGVVIGTDTLGFPSGTAPLAITTDGVTFTFDPASSGIVSSATSAILSTPSTTPVSQTSVPGGIVIGGSTIPLPSSLETFTEPDGQTVVLGPSGIVIGTDSISLPTGTTPATITTDGLTFTIEPGGVITSSPSPTAAPSEVFIDGQPFFLGTGFQTITESNGNVLTLGPNGLIFGSNTIPFPGPCTTITTFAIDFGLPCFTTSPIPESTSSSETSTGPLPIFTAWPDGAFFSVDPSGDITTGKATTGTHVLVTTTTKGSDSTAAPIVFGVPRLPCFLCGCWFCPPKISGFDLFGGLGGILPPGIYPPPPSSILPPGFSSILPSLTIGRNGDPTYSEEPTSSPTSSATSSSSSSSSSSCSTVTATDCTAFIFYGIDQQGSTTTSFTSSQCTTVSACSITPFTSTTSTSSVAAARTYVNIFPKPDASAADQQAIQDQITKDLEDPTSLFTGILVGHINDTFWSANLTQEQQTSLLQNPAVDVVTSTPDSEVADYSSYLPERRVIIDDVAIFGSEGDINTSVVSHQLTKRALSTQNNAPTQLKLISQPKVDGTDIDSFSSYVYDEAAGFGSTIYVIDSGANVAHPELQNIPGRAQKDNRFIFPGDPRTPGRPATKDSSAIPAYNTRKDDDDPDGHGSCVAGVAIGPINGVAKKANIVFVKTPRQYNTNAVLAWEAVHRDIVDQKSQPNAPIMRPIINYSIGLLRETNPLLLPGDIRVFQRLYDAMKTLIYDDGAVIVVSSGNHGNQVGHLFVDQYPALFGVTNEFGDPLPLIVVGAADKYGGRLAFSQQSPNLLTTYALGEDIRCPAATGTGLRGENVMPPKYPAGTSFATPAVAGLAAYLWSLREFQQEIDSGTSKPTAQERMRSLIVANHWERPGGNSPVLNPPVPIAWNRQQSSLDSCAAPNSGNNKRQCSASQPASSTPSQTQPSSTAPSSTEQSTTMPPSTTPTESPTQTSTSNEDVPTSVTLRYPPLSTPHCNPEASLGFDKITADGAIKDFCAQDFTVYERYPDKNPSKLYQDFGNGAPNGHPFFLNISLSWVGLPTDLCPDSKFLTRSLELTDYAQNCTNILTDIADGPGCKPDPGNNGGGSNNWNCVKWSIV